MLACDRLGDISFRSPSHFPLIVVSTFVKPVMLPLGRARLATKPGPIGSVTLTKTMGIDVVAARNAAVAVLAWATSPSGWATGDPAVSDFNSASVDPAQFSMPLLKGRRARLRFFVTNSDCVEHPDHRHCPLLRTRGTRPHGRGRHRTAISRPSSCCCLRRSARVFRAQPDP